MYLLLINTKKQVGQDRDSPPKFYKIRGKREQEVIKHNHRNIEVKDVKKNNNEFTTRSCSPMTLSANEHKTEHILSFLPFISPSCSKYYRLV